MTNFCKTICKTLLALLIVLTSANLASAQSTTGAISGILSDERQGVIANANIVARNIATGETRNTTSDSEGRYRIVNLPVGSYEITVEARGFAKLLRQGVELLLNQDAVVNFTLKPSNVQEVITVTENASLLNTSNAEVSTRFDNKRLSELPLAPNRDIMNVALSAAGVSQLGSGQSTFAAGAGGPGNPVNFSVNGMRLRSNNFVVDGQDSNDPSVSGSQQPFNNPDLIQEVRLVTNQFTAEYGRAAGSVFNVVTKSGTNSLHGSGFWFHNNNHLNACSNLEEAARPGGACRRTVNGVTLGSRDGAPLRIENQFGGTLGGPIVKDKTFFFGSYQRWTDRQLLAGFTINGAPTAAGKQILQQQAGTRPQVAALLKFLPAGQGSTGNALFSTVATANCNPPAGTAPDPSCVTVPLGSVTAANTVRFNNHQWSTRADHRFNDKHSINGRFFFNDQLSEGIVQATPPGLASVTPIRQQSANIGFNSLLTDTLVNEVRIAYQRYGSRTDAQDPESLTIPSIEINQLGLNGFNAAAGRTAIGLAVNLPQFRFNNTYQILDNLSWSRGAHAAKFGFDFRRVQVKSLFLPTVRGRVQYATLDSLVKDVAIASQINRVVPGAPELQYYNWYDYYFYAQDEWKVRPSLSLSYGLRYEAPGNSIASLVPVSDSIVRTTNDPRYALTPVPKRDLNNFQPRFGFSWNPRHDSGPLGWLTGGSRMVVRGGYSRTNDYGFVNINLNIASAFPFLFALSPSLNNAYANLLSATPPVSADIPFITRTTVASDFRSPVADQYSLEVQRELSKDWVMRVGYIATRGTGLFQTVDGNPVIPERTSRTDTRFLYTPAPGYVNVPRRVDLTRGVIRERANVASSVYHSMQLSLEKRLSQNFSMGAHYTWSTFIDDASEIFNPQPAGEIAVAQDPYNRRADRGRSSYDRPHRFTGNAVYEFPFFRDQKGLVGHVLGGWQTNAFFTLQSGTPFTVLNGADPAGVLQGIDGLVGNAIRPNLNTTLDISSMTVIELLQAGGASLFSPLATGQRTGNVGRNTLRGDGIANLDFGIIKNTRVREGHQLQFRGDFYNLTNTRNFGTPNSLINSGANFLNQWATNGGNRRILVGLRYTF